MLLRSLRVPTSAYLGCLGLALGVTYWVIWVAQITERAVIGGDELMGGSLIRTRQLHPEKLGEETPPSGHVPQAKKLTTDYSA